MSSILDQFDLKGAQHQAAHDDNPAIVVTAGAGSGKTRALVGRYLRLLEAGYPLRSLIAITFTRKAAREMRARIRAEIERWQNASSLKSVEGVWQTLAAELDSARIGTIHSLCAEILRAHPAEVGIDPHFSVLEEGLAATLKAQAVETALIWAADDAQAAALFEIFNEMELRRVLGTLLKSRLDIPPTGETSPLQSWSVAVEVWFYARLSDSAWKDSLEDLTNIQAAQPDDKLELARRAVLTAWDGAQQALQNRIWDTAIETLAQLRKAISTGGRKGNWDADDLETTRQAMRALREYYDAELKPLIGGNPPIVRWALDEQAAGALPALDLLITQVLQEYQTLKDEQQALDTDDLEGRAAQLLTGNASVRARWQGGIHAVLVDEFQDTNQRQRQIVYALTGFNSPSPATPHSPSTSLFVVGDAKQSIYRFRGADVTVFRQVQADIATAGGLPLDFDLTFRTHKPLLAGINALLAPILGERDDPARPYDVPFAPLRAYRQSPKSEAVAAPYIEFILGLGEDAGSGRAAAAGALAARLQGLQALEEFEWGDMALLFRASTAFDVYENALEAAGIPFVTVAGRGFYDRPEIRDLLNALAAIADPTDDLAMAGLLRSPAIGLSDADLYVLRFTNGDDTPCSLWEALQSPEDLTSITARAQNIISGLRALVGRAPAAEVLKRYLDLTGYHIMLGQAPSGRRLQRNVDKLLADAHRSRMVSLEDFLAYVQTLRDVDTREGEAPVEAAGAVHLMTVHKAKGLEFPLVVIADAAHQSRVWSEPVLLNEKLGLLPGLRADDGTRSLVWRLSSLTESERDEAEDKRLLYVAATRAQEKLLVNGHVRRLKTGKLSLGGWLARFGDVIGLRDVTLDGDITAPLTLDVQFDESLTCTLHPLTQPPHPPAPKLPIAELPAKPSEAHPLPKLAAPLRVPEERQLDDKVLAREADPPQRVWRVVPQAKRPTGPAWVVGVLVHEAIRHWRFPDDDFEAFITPFALEAGLTDAAETRSTIRSTERLLKRFQAHPLCAEIEAAERYHEVAYATPDDRGIIDLLYRSGNGWVIVDFKTDEVDSEAEMWQMIRQAGYEEQVRRYADAVTSQIGQRPRVLLVFLQVGRDTIGVAEIETGIQEI